MEEGARVVTSGRSHAPNAGEALHVSIDLSAPDAPAELIEAATQAFDGVDVLVNNVGTAYITSFEDVSDGEWEEMWQLNVMSYVRAIRAVLPQMRERRSGVIVNVSSTAGKRPSTGMPHYSVTKAAVLSLSRLVADVYAKDGIRCNAVTPGPTGTDAWLGRAGWRTSGRPRGGARQGRRGPAARAPRRARGDRVGDRILVLRACFLCHGSSVERGRGHRPDHHLAWAREDSRAGIRSRGSREQEEAWLSPLAVRSYETRGRLRAEAESPSARPSSATATGSSTRSRSGG